MPGEEEQQIKAKFLLPIIQIILFYDVFSAVIALISQNFAIVITLAISAVILFISLNLLKHVSYKWSAILFIIHGYALLTTSLLFQGSHQLLTILGVVFFLIVSGIVLKPKAFIFSFLVSALLIVFSVFDVIQPFFPTPGLPVWFTGWVSLMVVIGLFGILAYLSYHAIEQSLQLAKMANQASYQVEQEKKKFESIVEQSPQSIFITDLDGKIQYANPTFTELMGYSADELLDKTPQILKTEFTPPDFYKYLWETITSGEKWVGEFVNRRKDESVIYESAVIAPLTDTSGEKTHYVAFEDDITSQKEMAYEISELEKQLQEKSKDIAQLNEQLQELKLRDRLTGLYNRVYLSEILAREIFRSVRARNHLVLMIIDVDHFRLINDRYGYSTGDSVLQSISKSISESMERYDLAFRYGDDEFLLLFSGDTKEFGMTRAEQLRDTFENHSIQCDEHEIPVTVSIGISVYPLHGKNENALMNTAEEALEISRQSGGNRVTLWKEELNEET